jgi:hypothetical protein
MSNRLKGKKKKALPEIKEMVLYEAMQVWRDQDKLEPDVKFYMMGKVSILIGSRPEYGIHCSIAHPLRYPTWNEIYKVRYALLPGDKNFGMHLPPMKDYLNVHRNCFHLYEMELPAEAE